MGSFSAEYDIGATEVNTLEFVKYTWVANKGRIGSAVDLTMLNICMAMACTKWESLTSLARVHPQDYKSRPQCY